jgi:hypothetical protein
MSSMFTGAHVIPHRFLQEYRMEESRGNSMQQLRIDRQVLISDIAHLQEQAGSYGRTPNMFTTEVERMCHIRDNIEGIIFGS